MSPYDSDSSLDDADTGSDVGTNVLLGYASTEPTEDSISQLGGEPTWLDPAQPPSADLAQCRSCNSHLVLLLQLNTDLPERYPGHERRLYIWGCRKKTCRRKEGSIRAVRAVRVSKQKTHQSTAEERTIPQRPKEALEEQNASVGATLFGGSSQTSSSQNPFSTASAPSNPFSAPSTQSPANPFSTASHPKEDSPAEKDLTTRKEPATTTGFEHKSRFIIDEDGDEVEEIITNEGHRFRIPKCMKSVEPDVIGIDGHHFAISAARGVPEEITQKFYELGNAGAKYEDIPPELLAYEDPYLIPDHPPLTASNYSQPPPPGVPADDAAVFPETYAQKARISDSSPASTDYPTTKPTSLSKQQAHIPWPTDPSKLPKAYPSYHLDADYEYLSPSNKEKEKGTGASASHAAFMDTEKGREGGGSTDKEDERSYEDALDRTFQHFADVVAQNPEQVLRYEFGGIPLLYSSIDRPGNLFPGERFIGPKSKMTIAGSVVAKHPKIPRCGYCGAYRVFECQLTPHAIAELEANEEAATLLGDGMEWGTILVCVCSADCGGDQEEASKVGYMEEWVGVQWEEVVNRRNYSGSGRGRLEFDD